MSDYNNAYLMRNLFKATGHLLKLNYTIFRSAAITVPCMYNVKAIKIVESIL